MILREATLLGKRLGITGRRYQNRITEDTTLPRQYTTHISFLQWMLVGFVHIRENAIGARVSYSLWGRYDTTCSQNSLWG